MTSSKSEAKNVFCKIHQGKTFTMPKNIFIKKKAFGILIKIKNKYFALEV